VPRAPVPSPRPRAMPAVTAASARHRQGEGSGASNRGVNRAALPCTARGGCDVFPQVTGLCGTVPHRSARAHPKQPLRIIWP